jgi:aryl-alcohol dehydrogenase-like predicted oxidoreductase
VADTPAAGAERFILGTAQLRDTYGVAHGGSRPSEEDAFALLDAAYDGGVRCLDTSPVYADSESVIGRWRGARGAELEIVTKLAPDVDLESADSVRRAVEQSSERLGVLPHAVLVHEPSWVDRWSRAAAASLQAILDLGVARVGVSVYTPAEFERACELEPVTAVQAPASVFDRRLLDGGAVEAALARGISVHLRSVFLQGALLMDEEALRRRFGADAEPIADWQRACRQAGLEPEAVAVRFLRTVAPGAHVVIGCEDTAQLERNLAAWRAPDLPGELVSELERCTLPATLLDPRGWPVAAKAP